GGLPPDTVTLTPADVAPVRPVAPKVSVRVPAVPVIERLLNVAVPLALVVAVTAPPRIPPPDPIAAVTTTPDCGTDVPVALLSWTTGCCASTEPLTAVVDGWVTIANCVAIGTTAVTVRFAPPDFPSLVAVIVAVPAPIAVTRPVPDTTVATADAVEFQVTIRPVRTLPLASRAVAVALVVPPTARLPVPSTTETVATGTAVTDSDALPIFPSLVALMVDPVDTPVTTPDDGSTLATRAFDDCHDTVRPVSTLPLASRATAVACVV